MKNKFHGVFSLLLISGAVSIGLVSILINSVAFGIVYMALILVCNLIVLYAYCAKCECREDDCRHIFPGKIASLLPSREPGAYTFFDYAGVAVPMAVLLGFPQYWLLGKKSLFVLFWVLVAFGLIEILLYVCRGCGNKACPMCRIRN
jgi:hypothetical protein